MNIFSNPYFKSLEKEYKRELGIDLKKYLVKKELSNNEIFISDFITVFRPISQIKQKDNSLIKLTTKQLDASILLSTKRESLLYGGGRSGKTTLIALKILFEAIYNSAKVLCEREYYSDIKDSLSKTFLDIVDKYSLEVSINYSPPISFKFKNSGEIVLKGIQGGTKRTSQDKKLGSEYSLIYFNEASQISYSTFITLKTRLNKPKIINFKDLLSTQIVVDCNPPSKSHWLYLYFIKKENPNTDNALPDRLIKNIGVMRINPSDNKENIQDNYIENISDIGGTVYHRFVIGEFSTNDELSIFKNEYFKYEDVDLTNTQFDEVVIGVDPAVKSGEESDETGIVVVAYKKENNETKYYVLGDYSGRHTADKWLALVISIYNSFNYKHVRNKKTIVLETNNGGDLLKNSLRDVNKRIMPNIREISKALSNLESLL